MEMYGSGWKVAAVSSQTDQTWLGSATAPVCLLIKLTNSSRQRRLLFKFQNNYNGKHRELLSATYLLIYICQFVLNVNLCSVFSVEKMASSTFSSVQHHQPAWINHEYGDLIWKLLYFTIEKSRTPLLVRIAHHQRRISQRKEPHPASLTMHGASWHRPRTFWIADSEMFFERKKSNLLFE